MRSVKSKDSRIELRLRRALWQKGYRYRKHHPGLKGRPDIVFVASKVVIFCDSEFWHGHDWAKKKYDIKSNRAFWFEKIERNIKRDRQVTRELRKQGWTVLRFWGRQIEKRLDKCVQTVERAIAAKGKNTRIDYGKYY
jgi:DNA mismatch endonuclease (patch repair protein)